MPHRVPQGNIMPDEDGFGVPGLGGQINTKFGYFEYTDAAKNLFTLPAGAEIVNVDVVVVTAFNAGSTNTLSLGDGTTAAKYVNALALGSTGFIKSGIVLTELFGKLASDITFKATYNQSGTAPSAGKAYVRVDYIIGR